MLDALRANGPMTVTELGGARRGGEWWDWSDVKIAVEWLLDVGDVVCTERRAWKRVYDLPERALAPEVLADEPDDEPCLRRLVGQAGVGARRGDGRRPGRLPPPQARSGPGRARRHRPRAGRRSRAGATTAWADPGALAALAARGRHRTTLLSPFDSLVWDRARTLRVFDFQHRLEAYVPAPKRVHGYFAMPLRWARPTRRSSIAPASTPSEVEDVIAGCVQQFGEQAFNVARNAWLQEGLPIEAAATTVDRQCGSAQQAVNFGAALIAAGIHDVVIGSGVEHMGHLPFAAGMKTQQEFGGAFTAKLMEKHNIVGQGLGAEMIADQWEIPRSELDELALRSHQLAAKATEEGKFEREIVPFQVNGDTYVADQGIRPDTSLEALASLKPVFKEDGRITAGNSSQISDGAAAVLLMSREKADQLGLRPRARIVDQTTVGCDPVKMLEGPIPATAKILQRNGIAMSDIDFVEINEAFAPVVAAWAREHSPDMDRVNPRGGAMAIGHPLGSTGARLLTTLLHELEDEDKELGLVTMCCGGGLGTATLIQRV